MDRVGATWSKGGLSTALRRLVVAATVGSAVIQVSAASAAVGWSRQPMPAASTGQTFQPLNGLSCVTSADCVAVGSYSDSTTHTLAEHWNGTAWTLIPPANTPGASDELFGVSCPVSRSCVAVGDVDLTTPLAEVWNGTAWTIKAVALPSGATRGWLTGVSCTASDACTAVGFYSVPDTDIQALVERWDGTHFTIQTVPALPGGEGLDAVDCASAGACMAVGGNGNTPVAARWDGSTWTAQSLDALTGTGDGDLVGVSCPTASMCAAVGDSSDGRNGHMLAAVWNGSTWSRSPTPALAGTVDSSLSGVSCTGTTACTAVGLTQQGSSFGTLAVRFNGSVWALEPVAVPGAARPTLSAVSCTAPTSCAAVGGWSSDAFTSGTLAAVWAGPAWWSASVPVPASTTKGADLTSISCVNANSCMAVGSYDSGTLAPLAERWTGATWLITAAPPVPAGAGSALFTGVSCPLANRCVAVGFYVRASDGRRLPLADLWHGSWSLIAPADPPVRLATLAGVACRSTTACMAVGEQQTATGGVISPLSETLSGSTWTIRPVPPPPQSVAASLASVACYKGDCTAVGSWSDSHANRPLAEQWDGSWTVDPSPPLPSGATDGQLLGISCSSTAPACIATGRSFVGGSSQSLLAEHLTSGGWMLDSPPVPAGSALSELDGVSCVGASPCTAVGTYSRPREHTLADRWSGTAWNAQTTTNPAAHQGLSGVSCTTIVNCSAIGWFNDGASPSRPLSEVYS